MQTKLHLKSISTLFVLIFTLGTYGQNFSDNEIMYQITSSNEVRVVGYTGTDTNLNIPEKVNYNSIEYTVTVIGAQAFKKEQSDANKLRSVTIPKSVTNIRSEAFLRNDLVNLNFIQPSNLQRIGAHAFSNNNLHRIVIPKNVTNIGPFAFEANPLLNRVFIQTTSPPNIGNNVFGSPQDEINLIVPKDATLAYTNWNGSGFFDSIREGFILGELAYIIRSSPMEVTLFDYMGEAASLSIPDEVDNGGIYNVTSIGIGAFRGGNLTNVTIPMGITNIGANAFRGNELTSVSIPNSVENIGRDAFASNKLENMSLSDNLTSIEKGTFCHNRLTSITIPNSVASIKNDAFWGNPMLNRVTVERLLPPMLELDAFKNADRADIDLRVPTGARNAYLNNGWTGFKTILENSILSLARYKMSNSFKVYPNPVEDVVTIHQNSLEELDIVNIYNALGVRLFSVNTLSIDISHLSSGAYTFELVSKSGGKSVERVIVK